MGVVIIAGIIARAVIIILKSQQRISANHGHQCILHEQLPARENNNLSPHNVNSDPIEIPRNTPDPEPSALHNNNAFLTDNGTGLYVGPIPEYEELEANLSHDLEGPPPYTCRVHRAKPSAPTDPSDSVEESSEE